MLVEEGRGKGGSQGLKQYREFGSGMLADHRRFGDVTQGKKRQVGGRKLSAPGRTRESGGLWETCG